jgi:integrase
MRRSELLALRWCELDLLLCQAYINRSLHVLRGGTIIFRQPKTAKARHTIALLPSTVSFLRAYKEKQQLDKAILGISIKDDDLVFSQFDGKPLLPDTVPHDWAKLVKRTGLEGIRLHDARHTHASITLKQGTHPKVIQEKLVHTSIQIILDAYSHVAPGLQEAAADSFDKLFITGMKMSLLKIIISKLLAKREMPSPFSLLSRAF